jgi:hypothetical protein
MSTKAQTLFSVNDLQEVWALVSVSESILNQIHENQSVEISFQKTILQKRSKEKFLIEQTFEEANQRFARVRIELPKFKQFTENKFACYRTICLSNKKIYKFHHRQFTKRD